MQQCNVMIVIRCFKSSDKMPLSLFFLLRMAPEMAAVERTGGYDLKVLYIGTLRYGYPVREGS